MATNERNFLRCAIYTRKSSEHGLGQDFNSLHAQREAAEAYVKSQAQEGWRLLKARYDDGGLSGGTLERPALQSLLEDIRARKIDVVVVYKVDRLTRSLADFAKLVDVFEAHGVSFVAVTQQFNTTTSMGRLTLNVLLSLSSRCGNLCSAPLCSFSLIGSRVYAGHARYGWLAVRHQIKPTRASRDFLIAISSR
jgi:DNA invertase Pin-like site-specific DNA recombinase